MEYTRAYLARLERAGVRVLNGVRAFDLEVSKARQVGLLADLGLGHPATRVIHRAEQAADAASELRFPVVVKPNLGGSGAGLQRFADAGDLSSAVNSKTLDLGPDATALVQEWVPRRGGRIVRVEVLDGDFLYAIGVRADEDRYDLCPADLVGDGDGGRAGAAREVTDGPAGRADGGGPATGVEAVRPPDAVLRAAEVIVASAGMDVGGVEYMVDDRDGAVWFYDINANSNFVADAERIVGFDPFPRLAGFLAEAAR